MSSMDVKRFIMTVLEFKNIFNKNLESQIDKNELNELFFWLIDHYCKIDKIHYIVNENYQLNKFDLKDMFFHPEKKPTEYYTFDYAEINRIIKHPDILLNFIGPLTTREELFQMENMFYQFMRCESIKKGGPPPTIERDRNGLPINKCGFIWDFYKNMLSYKKYTTRPSNNNGEGSRKKTRRKKTRRKKTRRKKTRKKRPNRYR